MTLKSLISSLEWYFFLHEFEEKSTFSATSIEIYTYIYFSGSEEKLVRVFEATSNFIENISSITTSDKFVGDSQFLPQGASVPSLGLSNKAVLDANEEVPEMDKHVKDQYPDFYFKPEIHNRPPPEETLIQNTLWPEIQKLYGHGYEIFSIASNHVGTILVSACKATQAEHANIIVWDTTKWTKLANLEGGHTLTVVQMSFSPNDKYLLSVSRDRTLRYVLFSKMSNDNNFDHN